MAFQTGRRLTRRTGGFIVVFSLLCMFLLVTIVGSLLTRSSTDLNVSERLRRQEQAFQISEAGIDHALTVMAKSSMDWDDDLRGPDGLAGTADDGQLPFGPSVPAWGGAYSVRLVDNQDETPSNLMDDVDGVVRIQSTGTMQDSARDIEVYTWALFNHAIAAEVDILVNEPLAVFNGNIHANRNIVVNETGNLNGNWATATGSLLFGLGETLLNSAGDLIGGDPRIQFFKPDAATLIAAIDRKNPPSHTGTVILIDQEIAAYDFGLGLMEITPKTVALTGSATLVLLDGISIRFLEKVGPTALVAGKYQCTGQLNLNIVALGGGAITFEENACIRGLIWTEGSVVLGERSKVSGAVVSAGSSVTIKEGTQVTHDRSAIDPALLPGFWGVSIQSWQEL